MAKIRGIHDNSLFKQAKILKVLHILHWDRVEELMTARIARQRFLWGTVNLAEDGMVAVVESGMDCDCVRYRNVVRIIPAEEADAYIRKSIEWADGPIHHYIERPSVALKLEYDSRDLAMEGFENGNSYSL
jgi:acylphosphatase